MQHSIPRCFLEQPDCSCISVYFVEILEIGPPLDFMDTTVHHQINWYVHELKPVLVGQPLYFI